MYKKCIMICMMGFMFMGCGTAERMYDSENYESITNERGYIELYSGGVKLKSFHNAKVIYSDSNSFAMWIELDNGKTVYWQGESYMEIK